MFWRFGIASTSTIDSLLEKEDVTLEDVLNDADVLQESKANNEKLVEFFHRPGIVSRLLDYVVGNVEISDVSSSETEQNVGFKYVYKEANKCTDILLSHRKCSVVKFPVSQRSC